jgi:hypothetical protein
MENMNLRLTKGGWPRILAGRGLTTMLEKLIECACSHDVGTHDEHGCRSRDARNGDGTCSCRLRPNDVVDGIIAAEVESTRRRWMSANPFVTD